MCIIILIVLRVVSVCPFAMRIRSMLPSAGPRNKGWIMRMMISDNLYVMYYPLFWVMLIQAAGVHIVTP
jgi:hypothetical protein